MQEIFTEKELNKAAESSVLRMCSVFAVGFILGAVIVAIIDYYESKKEKLKRIESGADENYIASE